MGSLGGRPADGRKSFVEGTLTVSLEIESDVGEAGGFEAFGDGGCHLRCEGARQFVGRDFDACQFVMKADAELAEPQRTKRRFAAFDEPEALGRHFRAIRQARSETSGGGTIPGGKSSAPRKMANFGFIQTGVKKWREHLVFRGRAMARAKIESVIGVHTVGDGGETSSLGQIVECGEKFVLTEIAAIGGVGAVSRIFHFARLDEFVAQA